MAGKTKKIHQFIASGAELHIHREAKLLDDLFLDWGWDSEIHLFDGSNSNFSSDLSLLQSGDRILIHFNGYPFPDDLLQHPADRRALILHDYIPRACHHLYVEEYREQLRFGLDQLKRCVLDAEISIAHCEKASKILENLGAARVRQVPLLFDFSAVQRHDDPYTAAQFGSEGQFILTVGEIDGESGFADLLKTFWYFRSFVEKESEDWRLLSIGRYDRSEGTMLPVQLDIKHYEIPQCWMTMAPYLEEDQMDTVFRHASIYASLDHGDLDGAGPLQAITSGKPVLAAAGSAGGMVLGDSPLLVDEPIHSTVAESINRLLKDSNWREKVLAHQQTRLEHFNHTAVAFALRSMFARF